MPSRCVPVDELHVCLCCDAVGIFLPTNSTPTGLTACSCCHLPVEKQDLAAGCSITYILHANCFRHLRLWRMPQSHCMCRFCAFQQRTHCHGVLHILLPRLPWWLASSAKHMHVVLRRNPCLEDCKAAAFTDYKLDTAEHVQYL